MRALLLAAVLAVVPTTSWAQCPPVEDMNFCSQDLRGALIRCDAQHKIARAGLDVCQMARERDAELVAELTAEPEGFLSINVGLGWTLGISVVALLAGGAVGWLVSKRVTGD